MTEETGFAGEVRVFSRSVPEGWVKFPTVVPAIIGAADALADAFEDLLSYADMEFVQRSDDAVEAAIEATRAKVAAYRKVRGDA